MVHKAREASDGSHAGARTFSKGFSRGPAFPEAGHVKPRACTSLKGCMAMSWAPDEADSQTEE